MTLTIKEFKRFVMGIPEEFDAEELSYVDFSYADSLQCGLNSGSPRGGGVIITEWGEDRHVYWDWEKDSNEPLKAIPVRK